MIQHITSDYSKKLMSATPPTPGQGSIRLRPEVPVDEPFLLRVYASTRHDELAATGWDAGRIGAFLKMQFNLMRRGYAAQRANAQFSVVLLKDRPIGRLVVDRSEEAIELVDVALLPEDRGQGIGTSLIRELQAEANRTGKPIRLQVLKQGRPVRWYARLAFGQVRDDGVYVTMEWRPAGGSTTQS
jgi:ribosomal protein S18 acetylase RimI-like enzyme